MKNNKYLFFAILAAVLYAISTPLAKVLLNDLEPVFIAGLLYLGAGFGMLAIGFARKKYNKKHHKPFTRKEVPAIIGMILLDILAPILLLIGLKMSLAENVALLNNFEIVATAIFAAFIFKEKISKRLRIGIVFVTVASILLTFEDLSALEFSFGSLLVIIATISWGLENNLTRRLSFNDPLMVVVLKGIFSGLGSLLIALALDLLIWDPLTIMFALLLGFVAYGLSIFFYVIAQRELGAAKTSTFYAFAPFVGALISLIIFKDVPKLNFYIAIILMAVGSYYASTDQRVNE